MVAGQDVDLDLAAYQLVERGGSLGSQFFTKDKHTVHAAPPADQRQRAPVGQSRRHR